MPDVVLDASAMVDLLLGTSHAEAVAENLKGNTPHVPAHFDAEVLSALGRLNRDGQLDSRQVDERLGHLAAAPFERHALPVLLDGAWSRRDNVRLVDALYVELSHQLGAPLLTTDAALAAAAPNARLIVPTHPA